MGLNSSKIIFLTFDLRDGVPSSGLIKRISSGIRTIDILCRHVAILCTDSFCTSDVTESLKAALKDTFEKFENHKPETFFILFDYMNFKISNFLLENILDVA